MTQIPLLPISIQIYSLRNVEGLAAQLDLVQSAGYRHVELIGSHLDQPHDVKAQLDARGLQASSTHVGMAALREKPQAVVDACKVLGIQQVFMPSVPPAERDSPGAYWTALGRELATLARSMKAEGIALGYHNHHWELKTKEDGRTALELLFAGAAEAEGDARLTWQADVAWLVRGGADPTQWLQRYRDRVVSAHAKDIAPEGQALDEDGWADVGTGRLDWHQLARVCKACGARWLVAEHDKPNDPGRFARYSQRFLSSLEG